MGAACYNTLTFDQSHPDRPEGVLIYFADAGSFAPIVSLCAALESFVVGVTAAVDRQLVAVSLRRRAVVLSAVTAVQASRFRTTR